MDCGAEIFGYKEEYGSGGSGVGASAAFFGTVIIPKMKAGEFRRVLFIGTRVLLSALTVKQRTIPAMGVAVVVERIPGG